MSGRLVFTDRLPIHAGSTGNATHDILDVSPVNLNQRISFSSATSLKPRKWRYTLDRHSLTPRKTGRPPAYPIPVPRPLPASGRGACLRSLLVVSILSSPSQVSILSRSLVFIKLLPEFHVIHIIFHTLMNNYMNIPLRVCYLGHQPLISHPPRITINMPYLKSTTM